MGMKSTIYLEPRVDYSLHENRKSLKGCQCGYLLCSATVNILLLFRIPR